MLLGKERTAARFCLASLLRLVAGPGKAVDDVSVFPAAGAVDTARLRCSTIGAACGLTELGAGAGRPLRLRPMRCDSADAAYHRPSWKRPAMAPVVEARLVDITTLAVDAIVNAANSGLLPGGGVCGAIHRAAGPELAEACARLGSCPPGGARITPGFHLPAAFVIHAVGPIWHGGTHAEAELLASAYTAALALAEQHGLRSLAFPAISTGIYGYPLQEATGIAIRSVGERSGAALERVIFACFDQAVLAQYRNAGVAVS